MRDMTLNFKRDLSVFYRGKLCITENELKKMLCTIVQKIAQEIVHLIDLSRNQRDYVLKLYSTLWEVLFPSQTGASESFSLGF